MKRFIAIVLPLGFVGWILEGVITTLIARYIHRIRPDLLKLEGVDPVIQLSYLDYSAVEGKSWLHRCSSTVKLIGMGPVLFGVITLRSLPGLLLLYAALLGLFFLSRVPLKLFSLTFYPLIFAVLFIFLSGISDLFYSPPLPQGPLRVNRSRSASGDNALSPHLSYPGEISSVPFCDGPFFDLPICFHPAKGV